jgi:hypothetical protein
MRAKVIVVFGIVLLFSLFSVAQSAPPSEQQTAPAKTTLDNTKTPDVLLSPTTAAPTPSGSDVKTTQETPKDQKLVVEEPGTLISQEKLYSGARIYVAPMLNGFENYIIAGLQQKKVPVVVVTIREKADYEITGIADTDKAGWAKMLFIGSQQTNESASIKMVNLKTGNVVFAYSVNKVNSVRGKQSAGEACAKHIKQKIVE